MEERKESLIERIAKRPISKYSEALMPAFYETQEEAYIKGLAYKLSISKNKNYTECRNIVLNIHLKLERVINFCIMDCCTKGAFIYGFKAGIVAVMDAIFDIDFLKKINLIKGLSLCKLSSIEILVKINNLRNAFAHGYKEGHKKYNYYDDSIFEKKTVEKLISDYIKVRNEIFEGKMFMEKK